MPVWEFQSHLTPNKTIAVPQDVASQLQPSESVRVVLVTGENGDDADWKRMTAEQFLKGYASSDDIYDQLSPG